MPEVMAVLASLAVIVYLVVTTLLAATATLVFLDDRHHRASWLELHTSARIAVTAPLWRRGCWHAGWPE